MVQSLTDHIGRNNMFLFCLQYDSTFRLDELKTFRTFHALFGMDFFDHLVIEVTWYNQGRSARKKRERRWKNLIKSKGLNSQAFAEYIQGKYAKSLNNALKNNFPFLSQDIPVVFIDYYYYEFGEDAKSDVINQREIDKLEHLLFDQMIDTFSCEDDCQKVLHLFRDKTTPIVNKKEFTVINAGIISMECLIWKDDELAVSNKIVSWKKNNSILPVENENKTVQTDTSNVFERHSIRLHIQTGHEEGNYTCADTETQKQSTGILVKYIAKPPTLTYIIDYFITLIYCPCC